jgi:sulfatase maturation enzyme AslB (radical SAM superfamily)
MIERTLRVNPALGFYLHTNGSLGTKETWTKLGELLNGKGRFVKFAIDGLADTNAIYRRGVSWQKVMENAQHFISAGGRAVWKFIVFEHNKHQVEEARKLSQELGFVRFEEQKNYSPESEPYLPEEEALRLAALNSKEEPLKLEEGSDEESNNNMEIFCDAKKEQSIFMDFEGQVWPCCWMGGWKYSAEANYRMKHQEHFKTEGAEKGFNSLQTHSLTEVLNHPWFAKGLENSWKGNFHKVCGMKCGKKSQ